MKILILALILLSSINLLAEDKQLRIIKSNGDEEIFQLSEIKHLNFEQNTYSGICKFSLTNGDSVEFAVNEINSITFKQDLEQNDSIVVKYSDDRVKTYSIAVDDVKEIIFFNFNNYNEYIFTNIEIQIDGITAKFTNGEKEFHYSAKYSHNNGKPGWSDYIFCSFPINFDGNLNFLKYNFNGEFPYYNCDCYHATIFINEERNFIDSLLLKRVWNKLTAPKTGGSWRDESEYEEKLAIYSIPFEFNKDKHIIVNYYFNDLNQINYFYYFKNITGSSGNHTSTHVRFEKFLEIKDNAKIIIKLN